MVGPIFSRSLIIILGRVLIQKVSAENIQKASIPSEGDVESGDVLVLSRPKADGIDSVSESCCAICIGNFKPGETVVWSLNDNCKHVFHEPCMVEYLTKKLKYGSNTPCPICRQSFCDLEKCN